MQAFLGWAGKFIRDNIVALLIVLAGGGLASWLGIEVTGSAPGDPPMPWQVRVIVVTGVIAGGFLLVLGGRFLRDWWIGDKRLAISCDEIVIGGVVIMTTPGAPPGPTWPGTYLVARGFQLTNRSQSPVVLSVELRVNTPNGRYTAKPRTLNWLQPLAPGAFSAHHDFVSVLSEPALEQPINLDPTKGAGGRLTFYLSISLGRDDAENADSLRTADMKWEIHDSISDVTNAYPVVRTRDQWRVLPTRW